MAQKDTDGQKLQESTQAPAAPAPAPAPAPPETPAASATSDSGPVKLRKGTHTVTAVKPTTVTQLKAAGYEIVKES